MGCRLLSSASVPGRNSVTYPVPSDAASAGLFVVRAVEVRFDVLAERTLFLHLFESFEFAVPSQQVAVPVVKVRAVNTEGPRNIAKVCKEIGAKMLYISTDYVFPGTGERFYEPDDPTGPLGAYGSTKLGGELAVKEQLDNYFIVRISWVFGKNGNNFVKTMLRLAETHDELNVVCDQIGSPTYTADLAPLLCDMIVTEKYGTYHATNEGICSWADFAEAIFELAGKKVTVNHIPTREYPTRAVRPLNSRMSKDKLEQMGFSRLPHWKDALERYLKDEG